MSVLDTYEAVKLGTRPSSDTVFPCLMNKKMSETVDNQPFLFFLNFTPFWPINFFQSIYTVQGRKLNSFRTQICN